MDGSAGGFLKEGKGGQTDGRGGGAARWKYPHLITAKASVYYLFFGEINLNFKSQE